MVRKSVRSPRENSYYKKNKIGDDDFSIVTSDFATKATITNNATLQAAKDSVQKEYDAFVSGLDDRQKDAIKVLDTWFQLKSSCINSKSDRTTNLTEKELGMKLGIGAASISYSDGTGKAGDVEAKAFQKKITELKAELVEVRTELDRERSKGKKLKDASSTVLKARKKDIESLKSKLRYYKKENEGLTQKVLLYKRALEEADNHGAATNKEKAEENPVKTVEDAAPEEREIIEVEAADNSDDTRDPREEIEEELTEDTKPSEEEDSDLTFSEMMAHGLPEATQAPKLRPKFKISSSGGAFGSAPEFPLFSISPPSVPSLDDAKTLTEESSEEKTNAVSSEAKEEGEEVEVSEEQLTNSSQVSTPPKESASAVVASCSVGPGSAQKELEALRSMLKGRGGMANKKRFEMFEKKVG